MKFRLWLETQSPTEIRISDLVLDKDNIALAVHSLGRGMGAMTDGPVKVAQTKQGYYLIDGYHRVVEAILQRKQTVAAVIEDRDVSPPVRRYVYDPDDEFYGLEEFATRRVLRSLMG